MNGLSGAPESAPRADAYAISNTTHTRMATPSTWARTDVRPDDVWRLEQDASASSAIGAPARNENVRFRS